MTQDEPAARILVVDDDDGIRRVIRDYLEEHGYEVETAASAKELDAHLARARPDLIVLDVMMPGDRTTRRGVSAPPAPGPAARAGCRAWAGSRRRPVPAR